MPVSDHGSANPPRDSFGGDEPSRLGGHPALGGDERVSGNSRSFLGAAFRRLASTTWVASKAGRIDWTVNLETIEFFRFERVAPLERLLDQAARKHYSTFSLYPADELWKALEVFEARLARRFTGRDQVKWTDENVMVVFRKN